MFSSCFPFILQPNLLFTHSREMSISDCPASKSSSLHTNWPSLTGHHSASVFWSVYLPKLIHCSRFSSSPKVLSLSLPSLTSALGWLDSELGSVLALWPHPLTWLQLLPVQHTWQWSDSYLWLQALQSTKPVFWLCMDRTPRSWILTSPRQNSHSSH